MKTRILIISLLLVFGVFSATTTVCYAKLSLTLKDAVDAAIEKQSRYKVSGEAFDITKSEVWNWLDGAPSVSLLYLHNQTTLGTKEGELSLNLPIKSSLKKRIEKNLQSNISILQQNANLQQVLFFSGLIRALIWDYQTENLAEDKARHKQKILAGLVSKYADMANARAVPQYVSLLIQKESNDNQIQRLQHEYNAQGILAEYAELTGLNAFPDDIEETYPEYLSGKLTQHPDIVALDAAWDAFTQSLKGASKKAQPWNLQLTAKRVDTPDFSENQVGVGVDIPISIGESLSSLQRSEYLQAKAQYDLTRNRLLVELYTTISRMQKNYQFLVEKQALLDSGVATINALEQSVTALLEANVENQEIHIRNALDVIDSQEQITLNQIAIRRQIAQLRQVAGIAL